MSKGNRHTKPSAIRHARLHMRLRGSAAQRRARKRRIWQRDGGICQLCAEPVALEEATLDRLIPGPLGGQYADGNLWARLPPVQRAEGRPDAAEVRVPQAAARHGEAGVKPPFTYFGGKTAIAPRIAALLPPHEHYVEPFAGSLAVLLAKPPSRFETVNDLDQDLMHFWQVLRERPEELQRACALTPHSRAEYLASYDLDGTEGIERARRVWVRLTQGRGGSMRRTGWRYYVNPAGQFSPMPGYLAAYTERTAAAAARLAAVSLECKPALEIIAQYGQHPGVLIYADPPYLASVRNPRATRAGHGREYSAEMLTDEQHRELAAALKAARAAVILSGYHSPLYQDLYSDWHRTELPTFSGNAGGDQHRTEVLWSNRPFPARQAALWPAAEATVPP